MKYSMQTRFSQQFQHFSLFIWCSPVNAFGSLSRVEHALSPEEGSLNKMSDVRTVASQVGKLIVIIISVG